jgi:hypothetical protein
MGFHRRRIPEIEDLKRIYEDCKDDKEFLTRVVGKADAITGSTESMDFLEAIQEKVYPKKKTWNDLAKINNDPQKWLEMYQHYQELLTREDTAAWWQEQYFICDNERQNLKN